MKKGFNIKRAIIDATVERSLKEIDEDPQRSIRKLLDLGKQFSGARFSNDLYTIFQDLLRNEDSPYYTAIDQTLHHTDMACLKNFGINLGYNSFTKGARNLRAFCTANNTEVPFSVFIRIDHNLRSSFSADELEELIKSGEDVGVFTYAINILNKADKITDYVSIFKKHYDSAFVLFLPDEELSEDAARELKPCHNVFTFLDGNGEFIDSNALLLRMQKSWYGSYDTYNDTNYKDFPNSDFCRKCIACGCNFVLSLAAPGTKLETINERYNIQQESRLNPVYPLIFFDLYGDAKQINKILLGSESYLVFDEERYLLTPTDHSDSPVDELEIRKIFRKYLAK